MRPLTIVLCVVVAGLALPGCGGQKSSQGTNQNGTTSTMQQGVSQKYSRHHRGMAANGGGMTDTGMAGGALGAIPRCGAVRAVWVNTRTHVYHEPGDPYYGRTKNGKYLCPRQAVAEGDRPARDSGGTSNTGQ